MENLIETLGDYLVHKIYQKDQVRLRDLPKTEYLTARQRIKTEASKALQLLTSAPAYELALPYLYMSGSGEPVHFEYSLKKSELDDILPANWLNQLA